MQDKNQLLNRFQISLQGLKGLDNRKLQYDLMLLDNVLRVHVTPESKAVIIAKPEASVEKIISAIPEKFKPKVLIRESISYNELLKNTFNSQGVRK